MNLPTNNDEAADTNEFVKNLNILRQIDIFSNASMEVVKLFAFVCQRQSYEAGDAIFNQDEDDGSSYYILSGKADLILKKGGQTYKIQEFGPEQFLGTLSLMASIIKPFSLVAREKVTCLVLTRDAFTKVVKQFPEISLKVMGSLANKLILNEKKFIQAYTDSDQAEFRQILGISLI